jgi:hypothetical protein
MKLSLKLTFFFCVLSGIFAFSQSNPVDTNTYVIKKSDGNQFIGKIISDDGREVLINTNDLGKIYISKSDIKSIWLVDLKKDIVNNEFRERGVFTTRYQFSTNSFPIEKGENYAMVNLYGPEVHFAVSNRFSIGLMATWIASPMVLALKYTIPTKNKNVNFGFGTLMGTSGYLNQGRTFGGLHWGMVTFGDRKSNITLSAGYSYINLGNKNDYIFNKPGTYDAVFNSQGGFYDFNYNIPTYEINQSNTMIKAPIIGIAGITSVGKRASFIFDAMILFGSSSNVDYYQEPRMDVYDNQGQPDYSIVDEVIKYESTSRSVNFILMPGMRFQKSENKAFQISLAGVIGKRTTTYTSSDTDTRNYSFPAPMCSWFYKF